MKYVYKEFNSRTEIEVFFSGINKHIYIPVEDWYNQGEVYLYGCFYDEEEKGSFYHYLFCFGQTIEQSKLQPLCENTIFSKLKQYGSSRKYKGLKDIRGKTVLSNNFDTIKLFYTTETTAYFIVEKNSKKGICKFQIDKVEEVVPTHFEDFFDAGEYTWGYIKDGNVGFMSLNGKCITEARYQNLPDFNHFINGQALTCLNNPNGIVHYINHYGDCIGYPENDELIYGEHNLGTGYHPYGDLPDAVEAYENDESNYWNTD